VGAGIATVAIVVFARDPKPPTIVVGPPSVGQP
jgi:hypothetical protein